MSSLGNALAIFLPAIAGIAGGGGGGTPSKKGSSDGGFLSDAASAFLELGGNKTQPFQYADAPLRNRTIQELTRGGLNQRQPVRSVPGGPVKFEYANNTQLARVMRNLQENARNSQLNDLLAAYANPVEAVDTSRNTPSVKMTEVNVT